MNRDGPDGPTKRAGRTSEIHQNAWQETLQDMEAIAADLREDRLDVLTVQAGDTAPETPDVGGDRFGLSYVVPGNQADQFSAAFAEIETPQCRVYRQEVGGNVFLVTQITDADADHAILIAGVYQKQHEDALVRAASEADEMYTHVQQLDGTHLGSFKHEDWTMFFPDAAEA